MSGIKIVFIGTPDFAVPSLKILHESGYEIVGVVTAPDRPKGRGKKILGTPIKEYALSQGLHVLQPTNLKDKNFVQELKDLQADLQVVVAFRMLPEVVWNMPKNGTLNLHASLLPQYRGAAPIHWAIINGEKETGVTTFFLKHKIDTGSIILQEREPILETDTVGELHDRLMNRGSRLVLKSVRSIESGKLELTPQLETGNLNPAPKIHPSTCEVDWHWSAEKVKNFVRGLAPYPAAWAILESKKFKIFKAELLGDKHNLLPGEFATDNKTYIWMGTATDEINIVELQMEGKKRMKIEDFLRGNNFE